MLLPRRRTRVTLTVFGFLLLAVTLVGLQNLRRDKLTAAEEQLVGTWCQTADDWGAAKLYVAEYELRGDRTLHMTNTNRQTGETTHVEDAGTWRLEGDAVVLRARPRREEGFWTRCLDALRSSRYQDLTGLQVNSTDGTTMKLTTVRWDANGRVVPLAPQTCTWTRVTPPPAP